jgi:hypothetical protein
MRQQGRAELVIRRLACDAAEVGARLHLDVGILLWVVRQLANHGCEAAVASEARQFAAREAHRALTGPQHPRDLRLATTAGASQDRVGERPYLARDDLVLRELIAIFQEGLLVRAKAEVALLRLARELVVSELL